MILSITKLLAQSTIHFHDYRVTTQFSYSHEITPYFCGSLNLRYITQYPLLLSRVSRKTFLSLRVHQTFLHYLKSDLSTILTLSSILDILHSLQSCTNFSIKPLGVSSCSWFSHWLQRTQNVFSSRCCSKSELVRVILICFQWSSVHPTTAHRDQTCGTRWHYWLKLELAT